MFGTFSIDKIDNPEYAKATLRAAIRYYGNELQLVKTIEECGELQRAIARQLIYDKLGEGEQREVLRNLEEEWADAMIMLLQVGLIFDFGGAMVSVKLNRLMHRLAERGVDPLDEEFMDEFIDHMRRLSATAHVELGGKVWTTDLEVPYESV